MYIKMEDMFHGSGLIRKYEIAELRYSDSVIFFPRLLFNVRNVSFIVFEALCAVFV
jgi:hypothetical protein